MVLKHKQIMLNSMHRQLQHPVCHYPIIIHHQTLPQLLKNRYREKSATRIFLDMVSHRNILNV